MTRRESEGNASGIILGPPHAQASANASPAASIVASMSESVWAIEMKLASNCDGARKTPRRSISWNNRENRDPRAFYDAMITAGFPLRPGEPGTLGELSPKPHPWLYAEACRVGLGIPFEARQHVVGLEDSGAGVCSLRLAGFPTIGMAGGNIVDSGTLPLCQHYCASFDEVPAVIP